MKFRMSTKHSDLLPFLHHLNDYFFNFRSIPPVEFPP